MALQTDKELFDLREWAIQAHGGWKSRSRTSDLIVQGKWSTIWGDLTATAEDPLVEDIYTEALNDKAAAAAAIAPVIQVGPTRGTRLDRAEMDAEKRRRVFVSLMDASRLDEKQISWYFDWLQHGAAYAVPWAYWNTSPREPFLVRMDPRCAFPLSHDSNDRLTRIMFIKYRRTIDVESEPIAKNAVAALKSNAMLTGNKLPDLIEEVWYMDESEWGLAYVAIPDITNNFFRYVTPTFRSSGPPVLEWAVEPHKHQLSGCPAIEKARRTSDGEYRGALDGTIPLLRTAQNLMARIMEDVEMQIAAPKGVEGAINPEEYGPGELLIGDGTGNLKFISAREQMNYEAIQHVGAQMAAARNVAAFPPQRSGDFDASIASAKAVGSVMGGYSVMQGWAQRDIARFYEDALSRLAEFDANWCTGKKRIEGKDEGEFYSDLYDPLTFWKGDYRVKVGFHNTGLDEASFLTQLAISKNMGGLSRRSFMRKSGQVDNPLSEERDIAIEVIADSLLAFSFQQAQAGNLDPTIRISDALDDDTETVRSATMKVIKEMQAVNTEGGGPAGGPAGGSPDAALLQQRSLEQGGVPGRAAGLPAVGPALAAALPKGTRRSARELAPGGSGP